YFTLVVLFRYSSSVAQRLADFDYSTAISQHQLTFHKGRPIKYGLVAQHRHTSDAEACFLYLAEYSPVRTSLIGRRRFFPLARRSSSRTFRYGYLVTTSPQSLVPP